MDKCKTSINSNIMQVWTGRLLLDLIYRIQNIERADVERPSSLCSKYNYCMVVNGMNLCVGQTLPSCALYCAPKLIHIEALLLNFVDVYR